MIDILECLGCRSHNPKDFEDENDYFCVSCDEINTEIANEENYYEEHGHY